MGRACTLAVTGRASTRATFASLAGLSLRRCLCLFLFGGLATTTVVHISRVCRSVSVATLAVSDSSVTGVTVDLSLTAQVRGVLVRMALVRDKMSSPTGRKRHATEGSSKLRASVRVRGDGCATSTTGPLVFIARATGPRQTSTRECLTDVHFLVCVAVSCLWIDPKSCVRDTLG